MNPSMMEYVAVTLNITHNDGTPDNLYIREDYASLNPEKMHLTKWDEKNEVKNHYKSMFYHGTMRRYFHDGMLTE